MKELLAGIESFLVAKRGLKGLDDVTDNFRLGHQATSTLRESAMEYIQMTKGLPFLLKQQPLGMLHGASNAGRTGEADYTDVLSATEPMEGQNVLGPKFYYTFSTILLHF